MFDMFAKMRGKENQPECFILLTLTHSKCCCSNGVEKVRGRIGPARIELAVTNNVYEFDATQTFYNLLNQNRPGDSILDAQ
jgi:hypothetical protein